MIDRRCLSGFLFIFVVLFAFIGLSPFAETSLAADNGNVKMSVADTGLAVGKDKVKTSTADTSLAVGKGEVKTSELDDALARLESNVSSIKNLSTSFVQKKKLAAFSHEIEMSGMVYIKKPSTLAWHVTDPIRYSVLITDTFIRQWDEETGQVQEMSFKSNPMLSTALEQITVWFEGRYASLKKDYSIEMIATNPIVLRFTPLPDNMSAKIIKDITVGLDEGERYLHWIKIVETGGDTTTMTFMDTVFNGPLKDSYFEVKGSD